MFLLHVVKDEPFRWGLLEGAKGVQLAEKGIESWRETPLGGCARTYSRLMRLAT